jgi:hypothetical protein
VVLVMLWYKDLWHYIRTGFIFDFVMVAPWYLYEDWLIALKLLRVCWVNTYISKFNKFQEFLIVQFLPSVTKDQIRYVQKMTQLFFIFTYIIHMFSCIWAGLGIWNGDEGWITRAGEIGPNPND